MDKSKGRYADLHVHTWYSDSSNSPAQVVDQALANQVGLLAVADHEGFQGSIEISPLCEEAGICLIPASELQGEYEGEQYHILCYGADSQNAALRAVASRNRYVLDKMSVDLLERMQADYPQLSLSDYEAFTTDRSKGGWKGIQYLLSRGVTDDLKKGLPVYARYGIEYTGAGFAKLPELIDVIHHAGGRAVLAHPGYTLKDLPHAQIIDKVRALMTLHLDGIECYYPFHTPDLTQAFVALASDNGWMITAGSDCHGTFGHTRVGEMNVPIECLSLNGLRAK